MRFSISLLIVANIYAIVRGKNIFCYYDFGNPARPGFSHLFKALKLCTHLVYGYVQPDNLTPNAYGFDTELKDAATLKVMFPNMKMLLSIGGDRNYRADGNEYIKLLESDETKQADFINSTLTTLTYIQFDGIDLAFPLPKNKPRVVRSTIGTLFHKAKNFFSGESEVDRDADMHKNQFTNLVKNMRNVLDAENLLLTLTVLPNVNSTWYYDIPAISNDIDFVNLAAFDFLTPERNPDEADHTSSLFQLYDERRFPYNCGDFQVTYWLENSFPAVKIILGVPTYGRVWKLTAKSESNGAPIVSNTDGAGDAGDLTQTPGLLSYSEICKRLPNPSNTFVEDAYAALIPVIDPTKRYGNYAYRPVAPNGKHGIWISYEDPATIANKAKYVRSKGLGGMSLFDLSYDDYKGWCNAFEFPLLFAANYPELIK